MIIQYTKKYLTDQMARDKVALTDLDAVKDWFAKTPLGHEMEVYKLIEDGHYIKIEVLPKRDPRRNAIIDDWRST